MNIESLFEAIKRQMEAELEAVRYAITHAGAKGSVNEDVVKSFLRNYLPNNLAITSGFLIDASGKISRQLDIIIYDAQKTPSFFMATGIQVIPIECAYAVIEVKTILNDATLDQCIDNMKSVKALNKSAFYPEGIIEHEHTMYGQNYSDWPVLFFVFAFESIDLSSIANKLRTEFSKEKIDKRIDCIFTLEKGLLANKNTDGFIDAIPSPGSIYTSITTNHLLIFYTLLSRYMNQTRMKKFNFNPYIGKINFVEKAL